ncbi:MAG: chlorite dismutase family protein [Acidimicrobiales bacterium]
MTVEDESSPDTPTTARSGWAVLHLFCRPPTDRPADATGILDAIDAARKSDHQVVTAAMLGHKADLCVLAVGPEPTVLRGLQTALARAGIDIVDSYVSLTEVSEYAAGVPEAMKQARLFPVLPPEEMSAFCFYPMSKRRSPGAENWFTLSFDERMSLMRGHGAVGREFRGRVLQLITGSTGLDDYEWGVTLFGRDLADLKDCVYRMRFDEGSAIYADFGRFYTGTVGDAAAVLEAVGVG